MQTHVSPEATGERDPILPAVSLNLAFTLGVTEVTEGFFSSMRRSCRGEQGQSVPGMMSSSV